MNKFLPPVMLPGLLTVNCNTREEPVKSIIYQAYIFTNGDIIQG